MKLITKGPIRPAGVYVKNLAVNVAIVATLLTKCGREGPHRGYPKLNVPPGVKAGGHGGSHGHLMNEFVAAILEDRKPLVDVAQSLAMTVSGIVAHQSALKGGERMKIPQYTL